LEVLCVSMLAPVRKGEQLTAPGHRLGGLGAQALFPMPPVSSKSVSPVLVTALVGVLGCAGQRRQPRAWCLLLWQCPEEKAGGFWETAGTHGNGSRPELRACCVGGEGRPSRSLLQCRGGKRAPPSAQEDVRGGAEAPVRRPRAGLGGGLGEPLCHSLALGAQGAFQLPTLESSTWSMGSFGECYRRARGKETGLLVSIPELCRAQSDVSTQTSKAICFTSCSS